MDWMDQAACRGKTSLMFDERKIREARSLCGDCSVRVQCGEAGAREHAGVWGGEWRDEKARRRARAQRRYWERKRAAA